MNGRVLHVTFLAAGLFALAVAAHSQEAGDADDGAARTELNALSNFDPSTLQGFLGRPLFSPSRTAKSDPPWPPDAEQTVQSDEALTVTILGIVSTNNGLVARIIDGGNGSLISLRRGDTFHSWSVASIEPALLTFTRDGVEQTVAVFQAPATATAAGSSQAMQNETDAGGTVPAARIIPGASGAQGDGSSKSQWTKEEVESFFGTSKSSSARSP